MAYAELRAESEKTYAGFLWWILEPLASMAVYYLIFSGIFRRGGEDYMSFLLVGVVIWKWFQGTVMRGSAAIVSSRGLTQQVYFPKVILPVVSVLVDGLKFAVVFGLLLLYLTATGRAASWTYAWVPLVLLVTLMFIGSLTLLTAAVVPLFPDVRIVLNNVMRLWFFLSGVFYDLSVFAPQVQTWLRLNPMTTALEAARDVMLLHQAPPLGRLLAIALLSTAIGAAGYATLGLLDRVYPKLKF